jgi:hypothetical protein
MMTFWNGIFPKRVEATETTTTVVSPVVTVASTSANTVIRELTVQFTQEMKAKADKLDIAGKSS